MSLQVSQSGAGRAGGPPGGGASRTRCLGQLLPAALAPRERSAGTPRHAHPFASAASLQWSPHPLPPVDGEPGVPRATLVTRGIGNSVKENNQQSPLSADFDKVSGDVRKLRTRPDDEELKDLYGLYKQSIIGDIDIECPAMLDLKGKAKWEAWNLQKVHRSVRSSVCIFLGLSKEDAMSAYISKAKELIEKYGI
ncbi:hypothetical protein HPG69_008502 [Diceros bicornis minor]|uniref:ACB domain-containing protein n=1 Tax=Diceros bicornis minor TaxID=77932 RepID=A0A7J7FM51_DICBM|nr:hypothetical protein HPG69_008502 [Diceros bicornis minor]